MEELCPEVADFHVLRLALSHDDALLSLRETEDEQGEAYEGVDEHSDEPCAAVGGKGIALLGGCCLVARPCQYGTGHYAAQGHACLIEDAGQGIDDAGDALAAGVFCVRDDLGYQCPHVSRSNDDTGGLDKLGDVDEGDMVLDRTQLADEVEHRHAYDGHSEEDVEHILLAHLLLYRRHHGHEDERGQRPQTHEECHFYGEVLGGGKECHEDGHACRDAESADVRHEHAHGGEDGYLVGVARQG